MGILGASKAEIGARIKQVRDGMSQDKFAKEVGSHRNSIARYENGLGFPDAELITTICSRFDIRTDWLLTGEGPMRQGEPVDMATPAAAHPQDDNLGLGESVELLAKIYNSGDQVLIRAIAANLQAFGTAINDRARADRAVNLMGRMEERITALEKRLETEQEAPEHAATGS